MFTRWRCMVAGTVAVFAVLFLMLWLQRRPDPRIEALLSPTLPDAAIEDEVIQAELPSLDDRAIRRIAAELDWGEGVMKPAESWIWQNVPLAREWMRSAVYRQTDRRPQALRVLGLLGPRARIVEPAVFRIYTNYAYSDPAEMRSFAWNKIHPPDGTYISNLTRMLAVTSDSVRIQVASIDARAGTIPSGLLIPVLIAGLDTKRGDDRLFAARAIARYGTNASAAAPILRRHLADPDKKVRPNAAFALGFVAPEFADEAVACMLEQQRTNSAWTGDYAHRLYARLGPAAHAAVPKLESDLADPHLKMFHGASAVVLWCIRKATTPPMIEALACDIEHGVQRSQLGSLRALAEIGPPAAAAVPALERMTHHPRVLLRQLATDALSSIHGNGPAPTH